LPDNKVPPHVAREVAALIYEIEHMVRDAKRAGVAVSVALVDERFAEHMLAADDPTEFMRYLEHFLNHYLNLN
jgi:hypothetical protein